MARREETMNTKSNNEGGWSQDSIVFGGWPPGSTAETRMAKAALWAGKCDAPHFEPFCGGAKQHRERASRNWSGHGAELVLGR